jgi:hypothetical protein
MARRWWTLLAVSVATVLVRSRDLARDVEERVEEEPVLDMAA